MKARVANTNTRVFAGVAVAFTLLLLGFYWRAPNRSMPEELVGEWHSSDARYSDRKMEIHHSVISFTTGEGTVSSGLIKEIREVPEGPRTLYTVVYDLDGASNELSFYYETGKPSGDVIRFKNQQNLTWIKDKIS
jgi:hypothetical protein